VSDDEIRALLERAEKAEAERDVLRQLVARCEDALGDQLQGQSLPHAIAGVVEDLSELLEAPCTCRDCVPEVDRVFQRVVIREWDTQ
jgi:hypothetical protein